MLLLLPPLPRETIAQEAKEWPPVCPRPAGEASPGRLLPAHRRRKDGCSPLNSLLVLFYVDLILQTLKPGTFP